MDISILKNSLEALLVPKLKLTIKDISKHFKKEISVTASNFYCLVICDLDSRSPLI